MARGANSGEGSLKLFFMKIAGLKKGEKAHIKQSEARGDKQYIELEETINKVSGQLHKVETRTYQFEGEDIQEVKIWLRDALEGEMYALSVGMNSIGRSIVNTMLALEAPYGELEIRVYNKKDNDMPAVYMEHKGVKAGWKYAPDQLKPYITENQTKKKGQPVVEKDYNEIDKFLLKELRENVIPKLDKTPAKFAEKAETKEPVTAGDGNTDDLPF